MNHEKIQEIIKEKKMKIDELVAITGINKSTLNKILYGMSKNPGIDNIYAIARALDCSIYDFYDHPVLSEKEEASVIPVFSEQNLIKPVMDNEQIDSILVSSDSSAAFAVKLERGDMEPTFYRGDILLFQLFPEADTPEIPHGKVVLVSLGGAKPEIRRIFSVYDGIILLSDNVKETEPAFYPYDEYFNFRVKVLGEVIGCRREKSDL